MWRAGVTSECIHLPGFGASTPELCATLAFIGPVEGCAQIRVGGTLGESKREKFPRCSLRSASKSGLRR